MINQRKAGAVLSYIAMGLNMVMGFVYIPMLLAFLSQEQYGLYQLVGSMIAYLAVMDFGLANTTVRYYSRYISAGDAAGGENFLGTVLRLYAGISAGVIAVGAVLLHFLLPLYSGTLSATELVTARQVYWILLFNMAVVIPGHVFSAVIQARERFVVLKAANIGNIILQPVLVFCILHIKADIIVLALVQTACNLLLFLFNGWYCLARLKTRFRLHRWEGKFVREILWFSFFVFLNAVMDLAYWKTGQVILGAVAGTAAVAVYSVAVQFSSAFMGFSSNMSYVFLPRLSALALRADSMQEINAIFLKIGRLQFYVVMLIFFGFCLFGRQFIRLWVGADFLPAYIYGVILMGGLIIPLIQNTGILILQAKNKHAFRAVLFFIFAVFNVIISIPLARRYGALACAWTTTVCLLAGQGLILNIYYSRLGLNIGGFFLQMGRMLLVMCVPVVLMYGLIRWLAWPDHVFSLGAQIGFFILLYGLALWRYAFNLYEKELILNPLKKLCVYAKPYM